MDNNLQVEKNINLDINNDQSNFLKTTLGKVIDFSVDTGLRAILPDFVEDKVIDIKNTLVKEGFSKAINKTIGTAINFGKNALGIINKNFENISQAEQAIEKGGIINGVSNAISSTINRIADLESLPQKIISTIKNGKNILLNNVSSNIKNEFELQTQNFNKLNTYTQNWKEAYNNKNFDVMEKNMKKIKSTLKKVMPIESLITQARQMENIHEIIKNNGNNFSLSQEQLELAEILK